MEIVPPVAPNNNNRRNLKQATHMLTKKSESYLYVVLLNISACCVYYYSNLFCCKSKNYFDFLKIWWNVTVNETILGYVYDILTRDIGSASKIDLTLVYARIPKTESRYRIRYPSCSKYIPLQCP